MSEYALECEKYPFPSGKALLILEDIEKIPFDVLLKDYKIYPTENGEILVDNYGNSVTIVKSDGAYIITLNEEGISRNTYLLQHAAFMRVPEGANVVVNGDVNFNVFKIENAQYLGIDKLEDLNFFVSELDISEIEKDSFNNPSDVATLIRVFTKLGAIPSRYTDIKNIVDKHNKYFLDENNKANKRLDKQKRDALYNFISIKAKNISKDPVNLMLSQSGIDVATEEIKELVRSPGFDRLSTIPVTSDNRSVYSRIKLLILTLTGKDNVGIVASAMKVFEAISHHYYRVLDEGSASEQKRLFSNVVVLGKSYPLIANSYVRNSDSIKDDLVLQAYKEVNNDLDAFIMMSALLSLATDNAKDPTLSKLNATPDTLGCYTAGLVLGLTVEQVALLMLSDTGILLADMLKDNVFNPSNNKFSKLSGAIKYLLNPPTFAEPTVLQLIFVAFGLFNPTKTLKYLTKSHIQSLLKQKHTRNRMLQMASFVLNQSLEALKTDANEIAERYIRDIKDDPEYWTWKESDEIELKNTKDKHTKKALENRKKKHDELANLINSFDAYLKNPENFEALEAKRRVDNILEANQSLAKDSSISTLKAILNSNLQAKEFFLEVFDWVSKRNIIDSDKIEKYSVIYEIRKLNSFNEEMGDLRTVLSLNQGLPNSIQDLLNWINTFKGILSRAATRLNRKVSEGSALETFSKLNGGTLDIDLNLFLNNPNYRNSAILAYEEVKIGVNILDVMANSAHYRGYMKAMNLLYEGGKVASVGYKNSAYIAKTILPQLGLKTAELVEKFYKTITPVIFNKINLEFLWLYLVYYEIPKFTIVEGNLLESRNEDGTLLYETIRLGTSETNEKFKLYIVNYVYPYLLNNYPDNPFVKAISLRTYGYNLDHKVSVNVAKQQSYRMTNLAENVLFNEVKYGLTNIKPGIVDALFIYNLIAYNGQPGMLSLTDLFEDYIAYGSTELIKNYTKFITYLDESEVLLFSKEDTNYLLRMFAPVVYSESDIINAPYIYIKNPENNEEVLLKLKEQGSTSYSNNLEDFGIVDEYQDFNPFEDDNDIFGEDSKYKLYSTLKDYILNKFPNYSEAKESSELPINKRFITGKEILNWDDSLSLPDMISNKNKVLEEHLDDITLTIDGKPIPLSKLIELVKENGYSKEDMFDIFVFKKRKSRNVSYEYLDTSRLKFGLELLLNLRKNQDCNG